MKTLELARFTVDPADVGCRARTYPHERRPHIVYQWLALTVIALHFVYLAYLVCGGYLAWRWPRTITVHALAVIWGTLIIVTEVTCPLTWLQNTLRTRGGQQELDLSFIDTYVRGVFFPADHEVAARVVVALVIGTSWLGVASRSASRLEPRAARL